jgi:hypothetical protein
MGAVGVEVKVGVGVSDGVNVNSGVLVAMAARVDWTRMARFVEAAFVAVTIAETCVWAASVEATIAATCVWAAALGSCPLPVTGPSGRLQAERATSNIAAIVVIDFQVMAVLLRLM